MDVTQRHPVLRLMVCGGASHRISLSLYQCRDLFSLNFHPSISIISIIQRSWVSKKPETKRPSHWLQHYRGLSRPTPSVSRLKPCFNFLEPLCGASRESVNMAWPQVASDLPSTIVLDSVKCEGAVYVTVYFFLSLVSECTALHSLGQAMDM